MLFFTSCVKEKKNSIDYVDPFIGTGGHGHTYPGASTPFGMVQLSPDSRLDGWDGCSGYHYSDSIIYGFSHTHLSGTGVSDYGDILLMPKTGKLILNNGAKGSLGYKSKFSHKNETARPGFYQVYLEDHEVNVELTTSKRVGFHKYTFPKKKKAQVLLDLEHRDKLLEYKIEIVDSNTIQGVRYSNCWAKKQKIHYYIQFSAPFKNVIFNNSRSVAGFEFGLLDSSLLIKVGISSVNISGATANLKTEIPHWDFEKTKLQTENLWQQELNKIIIDGGSKEQKQIFYTALYHSLLSPNLYTDVNGYYNGLDLEKHQTKDNHYTVFSLWDTFRATHPLFTLIQQKKTNEFIRTFLRQYKEGGRLPIWELAANYTGCMIGYHAIPVITDAYIKNIRDYDEELALEAMVNSAMQNHLGLKTYKENGFIYASDEPESVSKNLEYSYDDWCIALLADSLGEEKIAKDFYQRGQHYKNLFDPSTGFFRAKKSYTWFSPFKPEEVNFNYTEANAWQYSLFVPQDINGHIKLMNGAKNYERHLDSLFANTNEPSGRKQPDITGLIGQYAHGNEPSHHMGYLYNYVGKPYKTQKIIHKILNEQYSSLPDGLSGNEDCGQMSAWYVLSSIGFYPVTPGLDYYTIGTPLFDKVTLNLENGNSFTVKANNVSNKNIYIQSASLNGKKFESSFIKHQDIMKGGNLTFEMGKNPSKWGSSSIPPSSIAKHHIVPVPYLLATSQTFIDTLHIKLRSIEGGDIYYSINEGDEKKYDQTIIINKNSKISSRIKKHGKWSKKISANYFKNKNTKSVKIESVYANQYAAEGDKTLVDGLRGGNNYRTGNWQGYREDLSAVIDLGKEKEISMINLGCLQDIKSWIFLPKKVEYYSSNNGRDFSLIGAIKSNVSDSLEGSIVQNFILEFTKIKTQYVKVKAINYGVCPSWHLGAGGKTWLFVDELEIK